MGDAGVFPLNLYARVRTLCTNLHTRPRVQRAPGIPCSLFLGEGSSKPRAIVPREGEVMFEIRRRRSPDERSDIRDHSDDDSRMSLRSSGLHAVSAYFRHCEERNANLPLRKSGICHLDQWVRMR